MIRKGKLFVILAGLLFFSVLLTSCQISESEEPAQDLAETYAAQTLTADQTQTAAEEIAQEGTQVARTQTAQAEMPTNTPEPTPTPSQETSSVCNWAGFIDDITIEDSEVLDRSENFTKVWRLENKGDCTWTTGYQIVYSSGYRMSASRSTHLPEVVAPGETVDISLDMVAPSSPGTYTGYWLLMDEDGKVFGVGDDAETPFWVRIRVTEEDETVVYNLADNYCDAGWESSVEEDVPCPSDEDFDQGFVQFIDNPQLEDGRSYDEPAILTYPDSGESGYMVGRFPSLEIEDGDHFRATIGCQNGADDCNVNYTLRAAVTGEGLDRLGQWHEVNEGLVYPVDVDLSDYAGMEIDLVLSAIAFDDTGENYAIWLDPRVVRDTSDPDPDDVCNAAGFVEDVTIEDRSVLDPGESFTKIWRLENTGNCTWTTEYKIMFSSGYQMGAPNTVNMPAVVAPGETVDISLDMVAPGSPGTYTGYWLLMDENEDIFGAGEDNDSPFWVRIRVTEEDEFVAYNLAENYCDAGWESSVEDTIQCPSKEDFSQGFVQDIDNPHLEDGNVYNEPAILTYPDSGKSGYMVGRYPEFLVEDGDHFRATIGCQHGANACNVTYTLRVAIAGEGFDRLGQWREVYEGLLYPIDVDLSDYAGTQVQITLSAIAADDTGENFAIWLDPRVVRETD